MKRRLPADWVLSHFFACFAASRRYVGAVLLVILSLVQSKASSQADTTGRADYIRTITARSEKIVNTLSITDSLKYNKVTQLLVRQYAGINEIGESDKRSREALKSQVLTKEELDNRSKFLDQQKSAALQQLHTSFITGLQSELDSAQLELVKDGMTYRVFPITYQAYQEMILTLTTEQKNQIYTWLKEAREVAMDAESSDKKHAVFGKYKGRINNYLSAAGYDLKRETEEWQKRIKEKKATK